MTTNRSVDALIGIYNAEGSLAGELRYLWGKLRGTAHCALCDITHTGLRQKPTFRECRQILSMPIELLHLDEIPAELRELTRGRTPCVVARSGETFRILIGNDALEKCAGDVGRFRDLIETTLARS